MMNPLVKLVGGSFLLNAAGNVYGCWSGV